MRIVSIEKKSSQPKYRQIVDSIEKRIADGDLRKGDKLPSLNSVKNQHSLSRDTVLMAFNDLKSRGIIHSIAGKGYYVNSVNIELDQKIFLLFDEFNSFKQDLYNSFLNSLGSNIQVDIFFHHFNHDVFSKLIIDHVGSYGSYVIMPANLKDIEPVIKRLPREAVYLLDQTSEELDSYPAIFQNFEKNIYQGLKAAQDSISGYKRLVLLYEERYQPAGIPKGFQSFCAESGIQCEMITDLNETKLQKGDLYLLLDDINLIKIIKNIKETDFVLSRDVGIISYNETLLKEIVEGGITTISTDFNLMGRMLADMVQSKETAKVEVPHKLIMRQSV